MTHMQEFLRQIKNSLRLLSEEVGLGLTYLLLDLAGYPQQTLQRQQMALKSLWTDSLTHVARLRKEEEEVH